GLAAPRSPAAAGQDLSERELGVLRLLHSELSLREIGAELFVSLNHRQDPHPQYLPQAQRRGPRRGRGGGARARGALNHRRQGGQTDMRTATSYFVTDVRCPGVS